MSTEKTRLLRAAKEFEDALNAAAIPVDVHVNQISGMRIGDAREQVVYQIEIRSNERLYP